MCQGWQELNPCRPSQNEWTPLSPEPNYALQHKITIHKELDSMTPDAFWAELCAPLISFYGHPQSSLCLQTSQGFDSNPPAAAAAPPSAKASPAAIAGVTSREPPSGWRGGGGRSSAACRKLGARQRNRDRSCQGRLKQGCQRMNKPGCACNYLK